MVLITGVAVDTTHPYKSTPGDDTSKDKYVITGVCFHPLHLVRYYQAPGAHYSYRSNFIFHTSTGTGKKPRFNQYLIAPRLW